MNGIVYSYSPKNVILTVGFVPLFGWSSVSIRYNKPNVKNTVGIYGRVVRQINLQRLARVTIQYPAESVDNMFMDAFHKFTTDVKLQGFLPVVITNLWAGDLFTMYKGVVLPLDNNTYDMQAGKRSWTIEGYASIDVHSVAAARFSI